MMMDARRLGIVAMAALAAAGCRDAGADDAGGGSAASANLLGEPVVVEVPAEPGSAEPDLTTGPDGRVYLSWVEPGADSTHALRFTVLERGAWSQPRTVASGRGWFVNWADFPSLRVMEGGRMAAHWLQKSGAGKYAYDVRIAQSADGGATWTEGVVPHRDGTQAEHGFASLWAAAGDSLGAVWLDGRKYATAKDGPGAETMLVSTSVRKDGAVGAERVLDDRICDCCQTSMARTTAGPVVVYRDRSPDEVRDISIVRQVNGEWTAPRAVHTDGWVMPACPVNGPAVSADGNRVAVAWFTAADSTAQVKVAFSDDAGAAFAAPVRIDGGRPLGRVDVELVDGGALVSWLEARGEKGAEVRVRHVARDGKAGEPRVVASSGSERASGFPRMVRAGGEVVFAWTEPGEKSTIRTARAPLGGGR
jgi:hypothetical protein